MRFSIVTALYNGLDYTREYLRSLEATLDGVDYELVLIDDGSVDGTREFLRGLEPDRRRSVILNDGNLGFARSNNLGASRATGDYLLLLNNDVRLTRGWLDPMVSALRRTHWWMGHRRRAGVVGNVQRRMGDGLIDHAGIYLSVYASPEHAYQGEASLPAGVAGYTSWVAATAACWLMERSHFFEFGGFDERYVNGMEDVDFCLQSLESGRVAVVATGSEIEHAVSASRDSRVTSAHNEAMLWGKWRYPIQEMAVIDQSRYLWLREREGQMPWARLRLWAAEELTRRFQRRVLDRAKAFVLPPDKRK